MLVPINHYFYNFISDKLTEEAISILSSKKKKTGENTNDCRTISLILDFKRYVFDKSMAQ